MRFWIIVYSLAISFFGYNCYTHLNDDMVAIIFGGGTLLALFIAKCQEKSHALAWGYELALKPSIFKSKLI